MAFPEDLAGFFRSADFAVAATWSANGSSVQVIFDHDYAEPFGKVQSSHPVGVVQTAAMPTAANGQTLTLLEATDFAPIGAVYTIRGVEPDGQGVTVLRLEAALAFLPNQLPSLAAWYRYGQGITSNAGFATQWLDQSGNARHVQQNNAARQPAIQGDGSLLFDGATDWLSTPQFPLVQPATVYVLFKQVAWASVRAVFDGVGAANTMALRQTSAGAAPQLQLNAGASTPSNSDLAMGVYGAVACVFNGAASSLQVGNNAAVTGNAGANSANGLTIGENGGNGAPCSMQLKEMIVYSAAHDAATIAKVIAYLNTL